LKRFTIAQMGLNEAQAELRAMGDPPKLTGDLEFQRAAVSWSLGELDRAAAGYERASSLYQLVPERFEACKARVNMGQVLIELNEKGRAASVLKGALKVAEEAGYDRLQALALSHLGALAFLDGDPDVAEAYLLRANSVARSREYLSLVFRNCYYLWKIAIERGDAAAIKANERTLRTYLGRVDPDLTEVVAFRTSLTGGRR
jgi:tetratricopeptide (TPR) repeat protein